MREVLMLFFSFFPFFIIFKSQDRIERFFVAMVSLPKQKVINHLFFSSCYHLIAELQALKE